MLYKNNEQYLLQLHCIGQGEFDLEQIRVEDTPISSFEEIDYEIIPPGKPVTLFETDVVTAPEVAGQELLRKSDEGDWIGPFVANPAQTKCHQLSIDILMPRGLYYVSDSGDLSDYRIGWQIEARKINDQRVALGEWQSLANETYTKDTTMPQRLSYDYKVELDHYEVRAMRRDTKDTSTRTGHELRWAGLKAVLNGTSDFGNVTLLAMKMRATDNLSQRASRMIPAL